MHNNYAIIDNFYNVLSGSPDFFTFFGATNFLPLLSRVHKDDYDKIQDCIKNLEPNRVSKNVCRIKDKSEEYVWFYLKITKLIDNTNKFEFLEIDSIDSIIEDTTVKNARFRKLLSMLNAISFKYNPEDNILKIFKIDANREYFVYNDILDNIVSFFIQSNRIHTDYLTVLAQLKNNIKNCNGDFSYTLKVVINPEEKEYSLINVNGGIVYSYGKPIVVGVFNTGFNGNNIIYKSDPMTGVLDKSSIIKYAKNALANKMNSNVILAIIDMDDFKLINDNLGHAYGDKVIMHFVHILTSIVGHEGAVGRYGGDEFMVVFDSLSGIDEIRSYFRAIRSTVETEFKNISDGINMTCSIGIVDSENNGRDYDHLFMLADECLYKAKDYGKNRYIYYNIRFKALAETGTNIGKNRKGQLVEKNELVFKLTQILYTQKEAGFDEAIELIGKQFKLDKIKIYQGEALSLTNFWGEELVEEEKTATYALDENYLDMFVDNHSLIVENIDTLEFRATKACSVLKKLNIKSFFQYIIIIDNRIKGLITFELNNTGRRWTDNQLNSFYIVSQLIHQIIQEKLTTNNQNK